MRKSLFPLVLSAALLPAALLPATAFAADKADITALQNAKVSMRDAISVAEKTGGGKAIDVTFDDDKGGTYDVTLIANDKTEHYSVPATMANATATKSKDLMDKVDTESKGEKAALATAKVSLSEAIAKAETSTSGKAIGGELKTRNKLAVYEVDVIGGGDKVMQVSVDSMNGTATTKN